MKLALVPAAVSNGERLADAPSAARLDEDVSTGRTAELLFELAGRDRATLELALEEIDRARIQSKNTTANAPIVDGAARAIRIALEKSDAAVADVSEQVRTRP